MGIDEATRARALAWVKRTQDAPPTAHLDLAVVLAKRFEGFYSKPYLCPAGYPTIGYGTRFYPDGREVTLKDGPINEATAEAFLTHELAHHCAPAVLRMCPVLATDERKFNAILDFTYNLGPGRLQTSTLRRKINEEDWGAVKVELNRWVYGGGRKLPGLVKRRQAEAAFFD